MERKWKRERESRIEGRRERERKEKKGKSKRKERPEIIDKKGKYIEPFICPFATHSKLT